VLANAGLDLHALAETIENPTTTVLAKREEEPRRSESRHRAAACGSWAGWVDWMLCNGRAYVNEKEWSFVSDMASWNGKPTAGQEKWLRSLADRVERHRNGGRDR
jgi:hypothetical protein